MASHWEDFDEHSINEELSGLGEEELREINREIDNEDSGFYYLDDDLTEETTTAEGEGEEEVVQERLIPPRLVSEKHHFLSSDNCCRLSCILIVLLFSMNIILSICLIFMSVEGLYHQIINTSSRESEKTSVLPLTDSEIINYENFVLFKPISSSTITTTTTRTKKKEDQSRDDNINEGFSFLTFDSNKNSKNNVLGELYGMGNFEIHLNFELPPKDPKRNKTFALDLPDEEFAASSFSQHLISPLPFTCSCEQQNVITQTKTRNYIIFENSVNKAVLKSIQYSGKSSDCKCTKFS